MKHRGLFVSTLACGLIPLTVGLGIFFSWWIGKAMFLRNLHDLELYGFLWIGASCIIVLVGFCLIAALLFKNASVNLRYALIGLATILLNIPAVAWVLHKQGDVASRAYVRLYNNSGSDIEEIVFTDSAGSTEMEGISNDAYSTIFFIRLN